MAGGMNFTTDLRVGPTLSMSIAVNSLPHLFLHGMHMDNSNFYLDFERFSY